MAGLSQMFAPAKILDHLRLEAALAISRRNIWSQSSARTRCRSLDTASFRTPQGFLVTQSIGGSSVSFDGRPPDKTSFGICGIDPELGLALQQNQLFLVATTLGGVTNPPSLVADISVAGWKFTVSAFGMQPSAPDAPILIIKYADRSVAALAAEIDAWASARRFAPSSEAVSSRLIVFFRDIGDKASYGGSDPDKLQQRHHQAVWDKINNPGWNGILVVQPPFPLQNLPDQIAGIAPAGFSKNPAAHHVGVDLAAHPGQNPNGGTDGRATFFGLIDTSGTVPGNPSTPDNSFFVQRLAVLFENAQVKQFICNATLRLNNLFGERPYLAGLRSQASTYLAINGRYELTLLGSWRNARSRRIHS